MSQAVVSDQPQTDKMSGLDQSFSPTISVPTQVFSMRGVVERHQVLQRLPGKVAEMKREDDVFHIHVCPNGDRYLHIYSEGLVFIARES